MSKKKKLITNPRIISLLIVLILAVLFIHPNPYNSGVAIRSIEKGSLASLAGMESPEPSSSLMTREKIISVNIHPLKTSNENKNKTILSTLGVSSGGLGFNPSYQSGIFSKKIVEGILVKTIDEYYAVTSSIEPNKAIVIVTNKGRYELITKPANETSSLSTDDLGIKVYDVPKNNLRKGLDLQGGTRVLFKPERKLTDEESDLIIDVLEQRLNIYGLSDIVVREAKDLSGNDYILIEIAGANEDEVRELIAKQGKFEAKIGNETVFRGGGDVAYVCRTVRCSGLSFRGGGCGQTELGTYFCRFSFAITLKPEAAQRQADITKDLDVIENITENHTYKYLSKKLVLYLDDELISELSIGEGLKGRVVTQISISGGGNGTTREEAMVNTLDRMNTLQIVLATGSLPVKLEVVKADSLSPIMGQKFSQNSLKVGLFAVMAVILIVLARYRKAEIAIPMVLSMLSELVIILGIAALIKWNLDLAAIAGIIVAIGTGVDDLIVVSDEVLDEENETLRWETKRKNAFYIIMAAYFTTVVAMIPLLFAGAGLLKGFALTTIIGISVGVFVVRPAFASTIKILLDE